MHNYEKCWENYKNGEFQKAIDYGEVYIEESDNKTLLGNTHNIIASAYKQQRNLNAAIQNYEKTLSLRIEVFGRRHPKVGDVLNNLGVAYREKGKYHKAIGYFEMDLSIQTSAETKAFTYGNLANVYTDIKEYDKAIHYYTLSLKNMPRSERHYAYNNVGLVYLKKKEYLKAEGYFWQTLEDQKKYLLPNSYLIARSYNNLGFSNHKMGNYIQAIAYYEQSLSIRHVHNRTKSEAKQYKINSEKSLKKRLDRKSVV